MFALIRLLTLVLLFVSFASRLFAQDAAVAETPASEETTKSVVDAQSEKESKPSGASKFVRLTETENGRPKGLETSIVRFKGPKDSRHEGVVVDLVGVVHIGQKEYYEQLKKKLATYDVVLYELVAPDGTRVRPEDATAGRSPLTAMQIGMRDMLNLEFQLEYIDYMAKNFRHADMSPDEFMEDMDARGDSLWKMGLRMMGAGLATQAASGGDAGMLMAMMSGKDRAKKLKQVMSKQLVDVEVMTAGMDDADGQNTLIRGRNVKAFTVLKEEIEAGKKKIAVFYGAGHLADMAERLESDFSMKPTKTEWLQAWDLQRN
jgi:hypothetical protein